VYTKALRRTLVLGLVIALGACENAPTSLAPDGPGFNRGQTKKGGGEPPPTSHRIVELGAELFADENLSINRNQSCQTCHEPSEGFAAPLVGLPTRGSVVQGSIAGRFGDRKPPTAAYATLTPLFSGGNNPIGGIFWDGRGTGHLLGNPAADQALDPFLNPVEQGLPDKACVVYRVLNGSYAGMYRDVWGGDPIEFVPAEYVKSVCEDPALPVDDHGLAPGDRGKVEEAYDNIARSLAAFEASLNRFSSLFDRGMLSPLAQEGQKLFSSKGKCQQCHENRGDQPVFTDFAFHNLGVPKNPDHPVYPPGTSAFDPGLGGFTGQDRHMGKFRTPTTRNVGLGNNRTYMHNGSLVSLEQVVDFYNTRDVLPECTEARFPGVLGSPALWGSTDFGGAGCWPPPEHDRNLDTKNMGKLGLTAHEVGAIVQYLKEMTDI
jgi:cytochrome c peroxidase